MPEFPKAGSPQDFHTGLNRGLHLPEFPGSVLLTSPKTLYRKFPKKQEGDTVKNKPPAFLPNPDRESCPSYSYLKVCDTPECLLELGCNDWPMLIRESHLYHIMSESGHDIPFQQVSRLPELLKHPAFILRSFSHPENSVVMVTSETDSRNRPIIVPVNLQGDGRYHNKWVSSNQISSAYGRNSFRAFLSRAFQENAVLYWDEKECNALFHNLRQPFPDQLLLARKDPDYLAAIRFHDDVTKHRHILVDMDGVLATWGEIHAPEELYQKNYFLDRPPMENCVSSIRALVRAGEDVYILSAFLADSPYAKSEKQEWLDRYLPEISSEHRIFLPTTGDKGKAACAALGLEELHQNVILLDDYNNNLFDFQRAGGTAVKALNGINGNTEEWKGPSLDICSPFSLRTLKIVTQSPGYQLKPRFRDSEETTSFSLQTALGIARMAFLELEKIRDDPAVPTQIMNQAEKFYRAELCSGKLTPKQVIARGRQGVYREKNVLERIHRNNISVDDD